MERNIKHGAKNLGIIKFDTLESLARRYGIILKAGFRDRDRILKAAEKIDSIRKKCGSGGSKLSAVEIIRKWRGLR